ncbi:MAG: hypothetical protein JWO03_2904 [Bacteroidetes bacterium]|nr:hypothetical protein [Bacteroidota bacterium]
MEKQKILRSIWMALMLGATTIAFCKTNISLTATQLLVNAIPVDSNTSLKKVKQLMAADTGRYVDWGALGFWYVCDRAGISFRFDADSTRLRCIYLSYHSYHAPAFLPAGDMTGTLSYLGIPVTPYNNLWTVLQRARGHVQAIAPDLYSIDATTGNSTMHLAWRRADCMPDGTRDGVAFAMQYKQKVASCVIYTSCDTSLRPLIPTGLKGHLYLNGCRTSDSLYREVDFVPENAGCKTDIMSMSQRGDLEMAFDTHDSAELTHLVDLFRDSLERSRGVMKVMGYDHIYDEKAINSDGYSLLRDGNFEGATAIFLLNTRLNPWSFNALDSYAEGLLDSGYPDKALKQYQESLRQNEHITYKQHSTWYNSQTFMKLIRGR